jgi:hypothetical protein
VISTHEELCQWRGACRSLFLVETKGIPKVIIQVVKTITTCRNSLTGTHLQPTGWSLVHNWLNVTEHKLTGYRGIKENESPMSWPKKNLISDPIYSVYSLLEKKKKNFFYAELQSFLKNKI